MARGEPGTRTHGRRDDLPEALEALRSVEGCHGLPEAVERSTIVTLGLVGEAEVEVCQRLPGDICAGRGERQGTLGGGERLVMCVHGIEIGCQKYRDLSQPTRVVEGC